MQLELSFVTATCPLYFILDFFKETEQRYIEIINPNIMFGKQLSDLAI